MKKLILCLWMLCFAAGCAKNPVPGKREIVLVSESQEIAMGRQSDPQVREEYGLADNPALQTYLQIVGRKLAAISHRLGLDWHFTVVDSPVVHAFAIPGGYVYLTRGILAYLGDEAELAGVLGHEIGHVTARHSVRQITRSQLAQIGLGVGSILSPTFGQFGNLAESTLGLVFLRFSRDDEREADRLGVEYAARAAWDPRQVGNFFNVLGRLSKANDRETIPGWLSTHPDPPERVQTTRALAQDWIQMLGLTEQRMSVNQEAYVKSLDGIIVGDNPRAGFLEGRRFYQPGLEFQMVFPANWQVENTRAAIIAFEPQQGAQIQVTVPEVAPGTTAEMYSRQLAAKGMVPQSSEQITINGYRAFIGVYAVPVEGGTVAAMAGFIEYRNRILQILGMAGDLQRHGNAIDQSIRSFEDVTERRILDAQPDRLKVYTARQGDTLTGIAERLNNPRVNGDELAILNRLALNQPIAAGRLIKTVERGY